MDFRQWMNRLSLTVSVPLAVYMLGQPHLVDPQQQAEEDLDSKYAAPHYYLVKPELTAMNLEEPKYKNPEQKIAEVQKTHQREEDILARAKEFTSIQDFLDMNLTVQTKDFLTQMQTDRFQSGNPYHNLSNIYPVALLLSKGVVHWNRHVFRSADFNQENGYDVVKYEITHDDTSTSYIFAYREKNLAERLWLGEEDKRPTLATFLVNRGDGRVFRMHFLNGEIEQSDNVDLSVALSSIQDKVEKSTPIASRDSFF